MFRTGPPFLVARVADVKVFPESHKNSSVAERVASAIQRLGRHVYVPTNRWMLWLRQTEVRLTACHHRPGHRKTDEYLQRLTSEKHTIKLGPASGASTPSKRSSRS